MVIDLIRQRVLKKKGKYCPHKVIARWQMKMRPGIIQVDDFGSEASDTRRNVIAKTKKKGNLIYTITVWTVIGALKDTPGVSQLHSCKTTDVVCR